MLVRPINYQRTTINWVGGEVSDAGDCILTVMVINQAAIGTRSGLPIVIVTVIFHFHCENNKWSGRTKTVQPSSVLIRFLLQEVRTHSVRPQMKNPCFTAKYAEFTEAKTNFFTGARRSSGGGINRETCELRETEAEFFNHGLRGLHGRETGFSTAEYAEYTEIGRI